MGIEELGGGGEGGLPPLLSYTRCAPIEIHFTTSVNLLKIYSLENSASRQVILGDHITSLPVCLIIQRYNDVK